MIRQPDLLFRHRLASHLGMSVARLLIEVDAAEFAAWKAYDRLNPIDHARRAELSAGILSMLIHNSNVLSSASAKAASAFMPKWGEEYLEPPDQVSLEDKIDVLFGALAARAQMEK